MFDTEMEGERVLCSLPLELFGFGSVEVEINCTDQGCTLNTKADLPVQSLTAGPLEHTASLYELVERFYVQLGNAHSAKDTLRIRDFTFPPFDPRHWGISPKATSTSIDEQPLLVAQFDYEDDGEQGRLSFKKGDSFEFIEDHGDGWLRVRANTSSMIGLVPSNYVQQQQQ